MLPRCGGCGNPSPQERPSFFPAPWGNRLRCHGALGAHQGQSESRSWTMVCLSLLLGGLALVSKYGSQAALFCVLFGSATLAFLWYFKGLSSLRLQCSLCSFCLRGGLRGISSYCVVAANCITIRAISLPSWDEWFCSAVLFRRKSLSLNDLAPTKIIPTAIISAHGSTDHPSIPVQARMQCLTQVLSRDLQRTRQNAGRSMGSTVCG